MIPEFGHFALILALVLATLQWLVPLTGTATRQPGLMAFARPLAAGQFVFVALSFACLTQAFLVDDFSVQYVANNSNSLLPWYFKFSAVWGGHEGSLLLWILILAGWTLAVATFSRRLPRDIIARVLAIMGMVSTGFMLFILLTSNPFSRFLPNVPRDGADLNPLLQDVGLIMHPPMLYMGYVGFSVAFAFALAALLSGRLDSAWARWSRPWTTVAWAFLSIGIALGSWWSYYELGWGGWWFWDPVENASFMPWLAGTALIHSLAVTEKRGAFKSWTVLLAIFTFSLSLLGTFLVRSGVLTSVHAFATDPARGKFVLAMLAITILGSLVVYAVRAPVVRSRASFKGMLSREVMLLLNNVFLLAAMVLVLLGTIFPLILEAFGWGKLSVGKPFFDIVFPPLALIVALLMGLGIFSHWKKTRAGDILRRVAWPAAVSVIVGVVVPLFGYGAFNWWAFAGITMAAWVTLTTFRDLWDKSASRNGRFRGAWRLSRSYKGMVLGHLGLALVMAGATVASNFGIERNVRLAPGEATQVGDYSYRFESIADETGPNYSGQRATFTVSRDGKMVASLYPEKRRYEVTRRVMTEAGISPGLLRDLFVALGEPLEGQAWAVRVQYKPLVRWLWLGGLCMALGGFMAIADRRYRIKDRVAAQPQVKGSEHAPEASA